MEVQTLIHNEINDFINWLEEQFKDENLSETFKMFLIVKLVITLRSAIITKKLYLLYHKFSL